MSSEKIIFHHIRNATDKITYNGVTILVDPMLSPKHIIQALKMLQL